MTVNEKIKNNIKESIYCLEQAQLQLYDPEEIVLINKKALKYWLLMAKKQINIRDIERLLREGTELSTK